MIIKKRKRSLSSNNNLPSLKKRKTNEIINDDQNNINNTNNNNNNNDNNNNSDNNIIKMNERIELLFSNLNSNEKEKHLLAFSDILSGCYYALENKDTYETYTDNQQEIRKNIEDKCILYRYLILSPNCIEIMKLWENYYNEFNKKLATRIMKVLLNILKSNYFFSTRKSSNVITRIVIKEKLKWIYSYFSSSFTQGGIFIGGYEIASLCKIALELLVCCSNNSRAISLYLIQHFNFAFRPFHLLANRKSKQTDYNDINSYKKDIRTQYIYFVLSFLQYDDISMIQIAMKTRFILPAIFHDLANDAIPLIIKFIKAMKNILINPSISRKVKTAFFSGFFLDQMATIYKTRIHESNKLLLLLEDFLRLLCCSKTCGIVYNDPDWYIGRSKDIPIRNKPLLRFILSLKASSNLKHQQLCLDILTVAPDIIESYLQQIVLSYEPRLSVKWIENISFIGKIISLPLIPFYQSSSDLSLLSSNSINYQVPISTDIVIYNIIPTVLSRTLLTQGLRNTSKLVQYQSIILLLIIFKKIELLLEQCKDIIQSPSITNKKEWKEYSNLLLKQLQKNLPDIQVILALHQQVSSNYIQQNNETNEQSNELLYERVLALLKYYQTIYPNILTNSNFDILKLISKDFNILPLSIQIHIISLLSNPDLRWTSQVSNSSLSYIGILIQTWINSSGILKSKLYSLITLLLSSMDIFPKNISNIQIQIYCFLSFITLDSINIFDSIISDCVRRRYELVDIQSKIKQELSYYKDYSNSIQDEISILICSTIRWYYKTSSQGINEQYYIGNVLLELLYSFIISPISILVIFNEIYILLNKDNNNNNDSLMDIDNTNNNIEIKTLYCKDNHILISQLLNWICNLISSSKYTTNSIIKFHSWKVYNQKQDNEILLSTYKEKISNISLSLDDKKLLINHLSPNNRIQAIFLLYESLDNTIDCNNIISYYNLDFNIFPFPNDIISQLKKNTNKYWLNFIQQISSTSLLSLIYSNISNKLLIDIFKSNNYPKDDNKHINMLLLLIQKYSIYIQDKSNDNNNNYKEHIKIYILLLEYCIKESSELSIICNTIIEKLYKSKKIQVLLFPNINNLSNISKYITNLCLSISYLDSNILSNDWIYIFDYYSNILLEYISNNTLLSDKYITIIIHILKEKYSLCSYTLVYKLIEKLLYSIQNNDKHSNTYRNLCFHFLNQQTKNIILSKNHKFYSLYSLPYIFNEYNTNNNNNNYIINQDINNFISKDSFKYLISLCSKDEDNIEEILLKLLISFLLSSNSIKNKSNECMLLLKNFTNTMLFDNWINKLNPIRTSILCILITWNTIYKSQFELYINNLTPWIVKEDNILRLLNDNIYLFKLLYCYLSTNITNINIKLLSKIHNQFNKIFVLSLQLTADITEISKESLKLINISEDITSSILLIIFKQQKYNNLLELSNVENDIKYILSKRNGPFLKNALHYIEEMLSYYISLSNPNPQNVPFAHKFIFYCMTCIQTWCNRNKDIWNEDRIKENILELQNILQRHKDWIYFPKDNILFKRSQIVFIGFIKSLFKYNFTLSESFKTIRIILQLLLENSDNINDINNIIIEIHQMITAHSLFLKVLLKEDDEEEEDINETNIENIHKYQLLCLLNLLYSLLPENECNKNLLCIYSSIYNASLHPIDQEILGIICQFENLGLSISSIGYVWGNIQLNLMKTNDIIQTQMISQLVIDGDLIDYRRLITTCYNFYIPSELANDCIRVIDNNDNNNSNEIIKDKKQWNNYDSRFILPFLAQIIEFFDIDCRRLIENGIIPYTIVCISSKYLIIRKWAYYILEKFVIKLNDCKFPEKMQIMPLFHLLRNSITIKYQCLSAVIGLFFCKSLIILLHPNHYLYRSINKFILHRPTIPLDDIPMFFSLIYSNNSDNQYQYRSWIVDTLYHSLHRYRDYKLYKSRHVFGIFMNIFDDITSDIYYRNNIIKLLEKACNIPRITKDLIQENGLILWLQFHFNSIPNQILSILSIILKQLLYCYTNNDISIPLLEISQLIEYIIFQEELDIYNYNLFFSCLQFYLDYITNTNNNIKYILSFKSLEHLYRLFNRYYNTSNKNNILGNILDNMNTKVLLLFNYFINIYNSSINISNEFKENLLLILNIIINNKLNNNNNNQKQDKIFNKTSKQILLNIYKEENIIIKNIQYYNI